MSKQPLAVQRLADQDSNWRRPRSPALNIPGTRDGSSARDGASFANATIDPAWPRGHSRQSSHANSGHHRNTFSSSHRSSSLERPNRDPSAAESWRSHQATPATIASSRNLVVGSLGSHLAQRRHGGFHAASNASEVARRAFVATEIGSIGSSGKQSSGGALVGTHSSTAPETVPPPRMPAASGLRPLRVEGFNTQAKVTEGSRQSVKERNEDWALTPTSSLPSLPSSPHRPEAAGWKSGQNGNDSGQVDDVVSRRLESHNALTRGSPQVPGPQAFIQPMDPSPASLASDHDTSVSRSIATSSPYRTSRQNKQQAAGSSLDRIAAQQRLSSASPRRASDLLSRFKHTVEPPRSPGSFQGSPRPQSLVPGTSSPVPPPSRKASSSSLASHRHSLQHSRRDSTSSQFSSPSIASIASSRPLYGVYRPPHLRNRGSNSGLQAGIAHYDRVRTPSLRGMVRSPEPPSRPTSTVPGRTFLGPGIPEETQFSTPTAETQVAQSATGSQSELVGEPTDQDDGGYFDLPHATYASQSPDIQSVFDDAGRSSVHEQSDRAPDAEDFDLTHEDILQTKTSLTDSYCLSRRSSMFSNFQVGNGVPVVDIFEVGDRLGPGMIHDGYPITIAETSSGFSKQQSDVTGTRLEVLSKLGEGSYAVVYLVQEVAGDGQIIVGAKDDASNFTQRGQPIAQADQDDEADATVGDTTIAGTLRASRGRSLRNSTPFRDDDYSSTLKAGGTKPRDSLASRVAAAEHAEREGVADHPPGIDKPQEGRLFALKCLCKRDLSEDMLEVQRLEATIHQSIPPHKNIVTLYRTYETPDWLFLALEYCPGQDLFYWLEQARDTDISDVAKSSTTKPTLSPGPVPRSGDQSPDGTPPSPSLLASTAVDSLLSRKRLRLISKMFRQMCGAVQFCHDRGIAHRDIKPENFIVEDRRGSLSHDADEDVESLADSEDLQRDATDGPHRIGGLSRPRSSQGRISTASMSTTRSNESTTLSNGKTDVVVKLTDFGLATAETRCQDFDCGSKPYMAYECRNNITSTYDPQQADIWSLGIVLLNLIFHRSPFREPNLDRCESFAAYCYDPVDFLMESFEGLTQEIAVFLSENVLCNIVSGLQDAAEGREPSKRRISARDFAKWAKDLPNHFGLYSDAPRRKLTRGYSVDLTSPLMHSRAGSNSSTLPSMLSSPLASNLVIEEDDDKGYAHHSLFPEYDEHEEPATATSSAASHASPSLAWLANGTGTPDVMPSPTFASPPSRSAPPQSAGSISMTPSAMKHEGIGNSTDRHGNHHLAPPKLVIHAHDDAGTRWSSATANSDGSSAFGGPPAEGLGGKMNGNPTPVKFPTQSANEGSNDTRQVSGLGKMLENQRINEKKRIPSWRAQRERRESRW